MRTALPTVTFVTCLTAAALSLPAQAQAPASNDALVGAWTLNKSASDLGATDAGGREGREGREGEGGRRGDGFGGRRRGGGGFGGGFGRGGGFGDETPERREAAERLRNALGQEMRAPDHMTIVSSATTVIITTPDGHTTRLAPDGKKIKDESTGVERRTRWVAGSLVSEVAGLGRGKITETYSVDATTKQLTMKLEVDGPRKTSQTRVYDLDPR